MFRILVLCFIVLLILAVRTPLGAVPISSGAVERRAPAQQTPAETRHWAGVDALAKRDFKAAEDAFCDSMRLDPKWPGPLLGFADLALMQNRSEDARSWLEKAKTLAPRSVAVGIALGRFHFARGELEKAELAYKAASNLDRTALLPRLDLADLYLSGLWRPRDAVAAYRSVIELDRNHAGAHYGLGVALSVTGEQDRAVAELERAQQLSPTNPLPQRALGKIYVVRKQYDTALAAIDRGLQIQPNFLDLRLDRAEILAAKGDVDQAIRAHLDIVSADPKFAPAYAKLGDLYLRQRRWEEAETAYLNTIKNDPENSLAYNNLAWMAAERGARLDDALAWAERAVKLSREFGPFQDTLARVYRARGELVRAADILTKAAGSNPTSADLQYHLGVVKSEQGNKTEAISAFKKALAIDGRFSHAGEARRRIDALAAQ